MNYLDKTELRIFREILDADIKAIKYLRKSRATSIVVTNLENSRMIMGKIMGELGSETPYKKDGKRETIADIEPSTDKAKEVKIPESSIRFFDEKRELYQCYLDDLEDVLDMEHTSLKLEIYLRMLFENLTYAKLWLGVTLDEIRIEETEQV